MYVGGINVRDGVIVAVAVSVNVGVKLGVTVNVAEGVNVAGGVSVCVTVAVKVDDGSGLLVNVIPPVLGITNSDLSELGYSIRLMMMGKVYAPMATTRNTAISK